MKLIISFEKLRKSIGKQKKNKEKNEVLRGKKVRTKLSFVVEVFYTVCLLRVPNMCTVSVYLAVEITIFKSKKCGLTWRMSMARRLRAAT